MNRQRREHFCQPEQTEAGACQKTRQVFVGDFVINTKTVVSLCLHCSPLVSQLVKHIESDGLGGRAGDGTRTRDSLLGRQELYRLSYSRREIASHARGRSGCADLNRGPHGPKPCALPTALHPAKVFAHLLTHMLYQDSLPECKRTITRFWRSVKYCFAPSPCPLRSLWAIFALVLMIFSAPVTQFEEEEIPTRSQAAERIAPDSCDVAIWTGPRGITGARYKREDKDDRQAGRPYHRHDSGEHVCFTLRKSPTTGEERCKPGNNE